MTCQLVVILWDLFYKQLLVFLCSWPRNGSLNTASRETFLRASSYVEVVFLEWHWGVLVKPDHISIAKRMPELSGYFHQALKWSPHLSVTGTGCLCAGSELWQLPASPSACLDWSEAETLEAEIRISESPGHTVLSSVCIYHPRVDMLKSSVQPNRTCKQKKSSAKRLPDRTVPL